MSDRQPQVDRVRRAYVERLISFVHGEVQQEPRDGADLLAALGLARAADLLGGQLVLFDVEMSHLAPVLGRTLIETCVYVQDLILEPDAAVDRLNAEADDQQRRLRAGGDRLQELEAIRDILSEHATANLESAIAPNLADLSRRVSDLRAHLEFGELEGLARVAYEMDYRWRSAHEVHPGIVVFGRYLDSSGGEPAVRSVPSIYPDAEDLDAPQLELQQDAYLLEDTVALRLAQSGRRHLVGRTGGRLVVLSLNHQA